MTSAILDVGDDMVSLATYLAGRGWILPGEEVLDVEVAGAGNMNLVLRVTTGSGSLIVKQGRPYVERFPDIPAPIGRTVFEASWYRIARRDPHVAARLPALIGLDAEHQVLAVTDLGSASDCMTAYQGQLIDPETLMGLTDWLAGLHRSFEDDQEAAWLENRDMRLLNHEHIFDVPLRRDNGLDLDAVTPGLASVARRLSADRPLRTALRSLGECYLSTGTTLLHGDFYPGSWLVTDDHFYVIDPEFGFFGVPEFDLSVMVAHLELSRHPPDLVNRVVDRYRSKITLDDTLVWSFAGAEILRRLLGVSQLPTSLLLRQKQDLLGLAVERIASGTCRP